MMATFLTCLIFITIRSNFLPIWPSIGFLSNAFYSFFARFGLIPIWHFFAPNPSTYSFWILYRNMYQENNFSAWQELNLGTERNPYWSFVYNPPTRLNKAVIDLAFDLTDQKQAGITVELSNAYLHILRHVTHASNDPFATAIQFCIASRRDKLIPEIHFLSGIHYRE